MKLRYVYILLFVTTLFSCSKDGDSSGKYIVSASKMIGLTGTNWSSAESQLSSKTGYRYSPAAANLANVLKATVDLPAVDDSNRTVKGAILLNISPDNLITFASFNTEPLEQSVAYAMMLNYNNESLRKLTGISFSIGEVIENGRGGNTTVDAVLAKVRAGQPADQLGVSYTTPQGRFGIILFRQTDGRYIFSNRGSR